MVKIIKGIVVFDSSGITLCQIFRDNTKTVTPLFAAMLGISNEIKLGSAMHVKFEKAYVTLFSGIRNPTLHLAIFSDAPSSRILLFGSFLIDLIDKEIDLKSGIIVDALRKKVVELTESNFALWKELPSGILVEEFLETLHQFGIVVSPEIMNLILALRIDIIENLVSDPLKTKQALKDIFGEYGWSQLISAVFLRLSEKYGVSIPITLIHRFTDCEDEVSCRAALRELFSIIVRGIIYG